MINKVVQDAMNEQINKELYSAYVYLSMSAYFTGANLPGFAHWMRVQGKEEQEHAMKFYDFIHDRGGAVTLKALAQPPADFKSPVAVFQEAFAHEQRVTASIHQLYETAVKEKDYPAQVMLQWFINEQVEEEKNAGEIVARLKIIGDHPGALFALDRELAARAGE